MQLVLNSPGLCLKVRNGSFWIRAGDDERIIGPPRISSILITQHCLLSSAALLLAVQHQIPVHFIPGRNEVPATVCSAAYTQKATLRQAQIGLAYSTGGTRLVAGALRLKAEGLMGHLQALTAEKQLPEAAVATALASMRQTLKSMDALLAQPLHGCASQLMGTEGAISAQYWPLAGSCLPVPFSFAKRGHRPATDAGNAVLNYAGSLLYALTERAVHAAGLDAWLGLLHKARPGRPTLVYDCIEPFRPWVMEWLWKALHQKLLQPAWVQPVGNEAVPPRWQISKEGRAAIVSGFNAFFAQPVVWQGQKRSRNDHVFAWCEALAGQIATAGAAEEPPLPIEPVNPE